MTTLTEKKLTLKELKTQQKAFYKSIGSVFCPILNEKVCFKHRGWQHLINEPNLPGYKTRSRNGGEQYLKLMFLNYAPDVVKKCKEISKTRTFEGTLKGKKRNFIQHELAYEVKSDIKVRVITEKIDDRDLEFLSVMPHDRKTRQLVKTKKHP
jgi:hypothetical protein